eukprot:7380815-Prymnesium_polylepis.1
MQAVCVRAHDASARGGGEACACSCTLESGGRVVCLCESCLQGGAMQGVDALLLYQSLPNQ